MAADKMEVQQIREVKVKRKVKPTETEKGRGKKTRQQDKTQHLNQLNTWIPTIQIIKNVNFPGLFDLGFQTVTNLWNNEIICK